MPLVLKAVKKAEHPMGCSSAGSLKHEAGTAEEIHTSKLAEPDLDAACDDGV